MLLASWFIAFYCYLRPRDYLGGPVGVMGMLCNSVFTTCNYTLALTAESTGPWRWQSCQSGLLPSPWRADCETVPSSPLAALSLRTGECPVVTLSQSHTYPECVGPAGQTKTGRAEGVRPLASGQAERLCRCQQGTGSATEELGGGTGRLRDPFSTPAAVWWERGLCW